MRHTALWLWSANGELVTKFDSRGRPDHASLFMIYGGMRYERMPRQSTTARVIHYQTHVIVLRRIPCAQ